MNKKRILKILLAIFMTHFSALYAAEIYPTLIITPIKSPAELPHQIQTVATSSEDHAAVAILHKKHSFYHQTMAAHHHSLALEYEKAGLKFLQAHYELMEKYHQSLAKAHQETAKLHESLVNAAH